MTKVNETELLCSHGHSFPVVEGIPVLLRDDVPQTIGIARASIDLSKNWSSTLDLKYPESFLETLGISENEKREAIDLAKASACEIDPVVSVLIGATNGIGYKHLIGKLANYPIPELRLLAVDGDSFLDIGCNWGRWSIAAARKGYRVTGIDPSLGALIAAKRVSRSMGLSIDFVCADARYLPFAPSSFKKIFSYSVLQHFSRTDAKLAIAESARVLENGGVSLIQMPNWMGIRSLMHLMKRGFSEGGGFDVRYWSIPELRKTFSSILGPTKVTIHCFFGLGLEAEDKKLMQAPLRLLVGISEFLRGFDRIVPPLKYFADSVYLESYKRR